MENNLILQKLNRLEKLLVGAKDILNVEELADYTGFSKSYIYKLVHSSTIPYSKPNGKTLFFEKSKIDDWLKSNYSKSDSEIKQEAQTYIFNGK
ncbi:DNA-binding protein [Elizabethkingia anophelis]|nr:DNA-binding protein [Elizabethkingia anophelis]MDV3829670.1 DNA-binding protein [Elizabethkingia anophelis]